MARFKTFAQVADSISFTFNEDELTDNRPGQNIGPPKRDIPDAAAGDWQLKIYPAGDRASEGFLSLFVHVSASVHVSISLAVMKEDVCQFRKHFYHVFDASKGSSGRGYQKFLSHDQLLPLFSNGELTIKCIVGFDLPVPLSCLQNCVFTYDEDAKPDFKFIIHKENENDAQLMIHKNTMTACSRVFRAMLSHDCVESTSNSIIIVDFDSEAVYSVFDFCYGFGLFEPTVDKVIDMLRFADKYEMEDVLYSLEYHLNLNITDDNYCAISSYAFEYSRNTVIASCGRYLFRRHGYLTMRDDFAKLPRDFIISAIKENNNKMHPLTVLYRAHDMKLIDFVVHLEEPYLESIKTDLFCHVANYAWKCSRNALKAKCFEVFGANKEVITKSQGYAQLNSGVASELSASTVASGDHGQDSQDLKEPQAEESQPVEEV